ncbi:Protein CBG06520 [Caenorhabditis briggsae]|uniref:Protein CBG06520 n=1 Tax=Caenorhabditis briggsae TaxID=6238 RepID=A8X2F3_CAEBR|nr:Protein CBG06520 [Caenorhabditis briggsae]CAP26813.2 Protein CBG06520 [Caenorhabditis briggsae]
MCVWRNSSYELDSFAPSILHKLAVEELPIHLLAAYVIIFKPPPTMKSVKRMMLLMLLCGAYLDLFISALSNQYYVLPAAAGHTQGLYTYLGMPIKWQNYMYVSGLCLAGVSILGFFENRFTAVLSLSPLCMQSGGGFLFALVAQSVAAPHPQSSPPQVQLLERYI